MYRSVSSSQGVGASISFSTSSPPSIVIPSGGEPTLQDNINQLNAARQTAIDSGSIYMPGGESAPRMVLPGSGAATGPKPVVFDKDGSRFTAPPGNYTSQDPGVVYCQGGNTPPCACATQEMKEYIVSNGLCSVTRTPAGVPVRGVGSAYSVYSAYGPGGQPQGGFKWYDKWVTQVDDFNPCNILRLPTCKTDCNAPWFESQRVSGEWGVCRSTRVDQSGLVSAYTPRTPVTVTPECPPGQQASSGGCVPTTRGGTQESQGSSMMSGGFLLLLLLAGGGIWWATRKKKGGVK